MARFSRAILHMLVYAIHLDVVSGKPAAAVRRLESVLYTGNGVAKMQVACW